MATVFERTFHVTALQSSKHNKNGRQLTDFYNLMILLGDGILSKEGLPSQPLIALSNYLGLAHEHDIESLAYAWNQFYLRDHR